jgi:capsular polysaccharide export protein
MLEVPHLATLLEARQLVFRPTMLQAASVSRVVCWGRRPSAAEAEHYARRHHLPVHRVEDAFVRSVGLGVDGAPPSGLVVDDIGIYYDATRPSRLESWLADPSWGASPAELARASACMDVMRREYVSKYNHTMRAPVALDDRSREVVVVADQTRGDVSLELGLVPRDAFQRMVSAALEEHPRAQVVLKVHPDTLTGRKESCVLPAPSHPRVSVLADDVNPLMLLERAKHVYVATSQLGFEALLVGKPVTCFGAPFYAGWGLTHDRVAVPRRGQPRSLGQLFSAAYFAYSRYVDPSTGQCCELEALIERILLQRRACVPRS